MDNAASAGKPTRKLVARSHHVSGERARKHGLVSLGGVARRIDEVTPFVGRVDGAGIAVIVGAIERVHVKAALGDDTVGVL